MKFTIGADPEFFLMKDNIPVSAYGLVPGTKKAPYTVENGAVQVDGTAVEFNITPASTVNEFIHSVDSVLASLRDMIPPEYSFEFVPTVNYEETYFNTLSDDEVILGCDPDWNAYTGELNTPPDMFNAQSQRTASGHIHIGWLDKPTEEFEKHLQLCMALTRQLDFFLGVPSLLLADRTSEIARRRLYGKAGSFRPKVNYGLEYRTLSSFWLKEKKLVHWVFAQTQLALQDFFGGRRIAEDFAKYFPTIINHYQTDYAKYIIECMQWDLP